MSKKSYLRSNKSKHQSNSKIEEITKEVNSVIGEEVVAIEEATPELHYYNTKKTKYWLWTIIIAVFLGAMIIIPWVISCIELLFRTIPFWRDDPSTLHQLNLGILPDFLGGMVGIIVGFGIELVLFNKLKILDKYEALKTPLELELKSIYESLNNKLNFLALIMEDEVAQKTLHLSKVDPNTLTDLVKKHTENYSDKYKNYYKIKLITIDDIVSSAENNVVFCKLPYLSKQAKLSRDKLYDLLIIIYSKICRYNEEHDLYQKAKNEDVAKHENSMKNYICEIYSKILALSKISGLSLNKE